MRDISRLSQKLVRVEAVAAPGNPKAAAADPGEGRGPGRSTRPLPHRYAEAALDGEGSEG